eukprot:4980064-Alexandrium_andersonii.AAC.1
MGSQRALASTLAGVLDVDGALAWTCSQAVAGGPRAWSPKRPPVSAWPVAPSPEGEWTTDPAEAGRRF